MSKSIILYKVAPLLTLACIIVKGFTKPFLGLGIKGKGNRAVFYYSKLLKLSKG